MFDAAEQSMLGGEITSVHEGSIMVKVHPGMSDQTNSNIARDGAPKRTPSKPAVKDGMKNQTKELSGVSPANPGVGPDADPANPLGPASPAKNIATPAKAWGMKGEHSPALGSAVLNEAANLGR